jgi:hypothetical protein
MTLVEVFFFVNFVQCYASLDLNVKLPSSQDIVECCFCFQALLKFGLV